MTLSGNKILFLEKNMGRRKIEIKPITDERIKQATFNKRKLGLMKKAYELSVLCQCEVGFMIFNPNNRLTQFASSDMDQILLRYASFSEPSESRNNQDVGASHHFDRLMARKESQGGVIGGDDSDEEDGFSPEAPSSAKRTRRFGPLTSTPNQTQTPGIQTTVPPMSHTLTQASEKSSISGSPTKRKPPSGLSLQPFQSNEFSLPQFSPGPFSATFTRANTIYGGLLPSPGLYGVQNPFSPIAPNSLSWRSVPSQAPVSLPTIPAIEDIAGKQKGQQNSEQQQQNIVKKAKI